MSKPKPKAEIVIKGPGTRSPILIYTASADAYEWIAREAPQFGKLFLPDEITRNFYLFVDPLYDVSEVSAYLLAGKGEE